MEGFALKNQYFQRLRAKGIQYRKEQNGIVINCENGLFSSGVSAAYKFWAIAERYNASDIYIDEFPPEDSIKELIATFQEADISSFVISKSKLCRETDLVSLGCKLAGECKVYRQETELYTGQLEIIKGIRVLLGSNGND